MNTHAAKQVSVAVDPLRRPRPLELKRCRGNAKCLRVHQNRNTLLIPGEKLLLFQCSVDIQHEVLHDVETHFSPSCFKFRPSATKNNSII